MKDINWKAVAMGYDAAFKIFKKKLKKRRMTKYEVTNAMELIEGTTRYTGFQHADLVVEAVVENMDIKKAVFKDLDEKTNPKAILATKGVPDLIQRRMVSISGAGNCDCSAGGIAPSCTCSYRVLFSGAPETSTGPDSPPRNRP